MTASTPVRAPSVALLTAIPPPPAASTMRPASSSSRIASCSTMSIGTGEATTRRCPRPESSTTRQPRCASQLGRSFGAEERSDRLGRAIERRVVRVYPDVGHDHYRDTSPADPVDLTGQHATKLTLSHGAELVQRLRRNDGAGLFLLDRQVADLRTVAVHDCDSPPCISEIGQA